MYKYKIYLASSWRNPFYEDVLTLIKDTNCFDIYNWKDKEESFCFNWSDIDSNWQNWSIPEFRKQLEHESCEKGFESDSNAYKACDIGVLLLPSGASSHIEYGYIRGQGKPGVIYIPEKLDSGYYELTRKWEPELIYKESVGIVINHIELMNSLYNIREGLINRWIMNT